MLIEKPHGVLNKLLIACTVKGMRHILIVDAFHTLTEGCKLIAGEDRPIYWNGSIRCAVMDADCRGDVLKKIHR